METSQPLHDESLFVRIFQKFYYSSVFAIACGCIGQIFGNIVVGNKFGEDKLAIMSLVLPLYYIFATIGNLAGIGGSALCAKWIGERDNDACRKSFTVTYLLTAVLCVFFSGLVLLFLPRLVSLLGTPDALYEDVKVYSAIMSAGGVFTAGVYLSFNFLRLEGKSVATTMTFVIMAAVNVILDILLAPLGIAGIALANILGSAAATVFGMVLLLPRSSLLTFRRVKAREALSLSLQIFKVGSPGATENASILLKSYLLNRLITDSLGPAALSSLSIVNSVNSFSMAITVGGAGALVPIIGVFSAERDTVSMRKTVRSALRISGLLLAVFLVVLLAFAPAVARLFGVTGDIAATAAAVRIFAASLPLALLTNCLIYLHLANNHTVISNLLTVLRCFVFPVGLAFLLMRPWHATGLWLSFAACEIAVLAAAALCHILARRKNPDLSPVLLLDTRFEKNGSSIALVTEDDDVSLSETVKQLEAFCEQNDLPPKRAMILTLSMDEMLHMAAEHSTRPAGQHIISIRVIVLEDVLVLRLRYVGDLFNPIEYYEQKKTDATDIDAMLELADCLGMKLVTDACEVVDYRTTFGINNLTILT